MLWQSDYALRKLDGKVDRCVLEDINKLKMNATTIDGHTSHGEPHTWVGINIHVIIVLM